MRRLLVFPVSLVVLIPTTGLAEQLTAGEVLDKVSQTYRNARSFRFAGGPGSGLEIALERPGEIRSGGSIPTLVSNGKQTWVYSPAVHQYGELFAVPLLDEAWAPAHGTKFDTLWEDLYPAFYQYFDLPRQKGNAKLLGEETLSVRSKEVPCYVVTCSISAVPHKLWVDKEHFVVVRDEWLNPPDQYDIGNFAFGTGSSAPMTDLGPISEDVFEFIPPKGARRIEPFGLTGGLEQFWDTRGAYSLLSFFSDRRMHGKNAPEFTSAYLDGKSVRLHDLRGKIVVLDFSACWCKPCQEELSDIQRLHNELASKGVVFLGIDDEDAETVKSFVKKNGYTFPTLLDPNQTVHQLYGVRWVPTVVVINRRGKIAARYVGEGGEAGLRKALAAAGLKN